MTKQLPALIALLALSILGTHSLEARPFTSTNGVIIDAEIVSVSGNSVVIRRTDNRQTYTLDISKFSQPDQTYIRDWAVKEAQNRIPRMEVDVSSGRNQVNDKSDGFDDRSGSFDINVTVKNRENDFDIQGAKATIWVIGESCKYRNEYIIFQRETWALNAESGKESTWQGPEVSYRFDDRKPTMWGHKYYGYVLVIKNSADKVIFSKTSPAKFEDDVERAWDLKVKNVCDDKLKKLSRTHYVYF